jgi:hypothetical protein
MNLVDWRASQKDPKTVEYLEEQKESQKESRMGTTKEVKMDTN